MRHYLLPDGRPYLDKPITPKPVPPQWSYAYLGDRLLARFDNAGNIEHVVTDHIGYPMATISYTATIQWQPDPEPFGDVYAEQQVGPGHDPLMRYPGQWRVDPVLATTEPAFTTLYYNTHRWYNPSWGRYAESDPLPSTIGYHPFAYARNNPFSWVDPNGLQPVPPADCPHPPVPDNCVCGKWQLASQFRDDLASWRVWTLVSQRQQEEHFRCWCRWRLSGEREQYRWTYLWVAETTCFPCFRGEDVYVFDYGPLELHYTPIWGGEAYTCQVRWLMF